MPILVSINCITYNHEEYIADAIESFLMQITDFKFEILIGEDCSTDNTKKIVEEYANRYPDKIRVITSNKNVGAGKNWRRVIDNCKGKYIAECEGDDYWIDPYKLQKQVDYLEGNPECTMCFHAANVVQIPAKKMDRKLSPYSKDRISPIEDIISGGGGFCPTASLVYPRALIENLPGFYETAHVGDYPMQLILSSQGYAFYIDKCMAVYRKGVKGSWSDRMSSGEHKKEKLIEANKGDIEILEGFNEYTNFKYSKIVEKVILKKEFLILIIQMKIKGKRNIKYQEYLKGLGLIGMLKIYLSFFFPGLYGTLVNLKISIMN